MRFLSSQDRCEDGWIDSMAEYFAIIEEHDRYLVPVCPCKMGVAVDVDDGHTDFRAQFPHHSFDERFRIIAEVTVLPAQDCNSHMDLRGGDKVRTLPWQ